MQVAVYKPLDARQFFPQPVSLKRKQRVLIMRYSIGRGNYCQECDRSFPDENALEQHLNSSTHQPRQVRCPFEDLGCASNGFTSIAALARHFDSNGCALITRRRFNGIAYDLSQSGDRDQPFRVIKPDVNPRNMGFKRRVHRVVKRAWRKLLEGEEDPWTCTYPDSEGECGAELTTIAGLKAHLKSPKHEARMYRCPGCTTCFADLGSASSHIAADLPACNLNARAEMRKVLELINAVTQRQDPRARRLNRRILSL
ncbi:hypothetical protein MD484_g2552, partial [Candolleomyces efflorescens]